MKLIGIVAGESSGDRLGAGLIESLRQRFPEVRVCGIVGPQMLAAGSEMLYPAERLAVMGIGEILRRYRELHAMRKDVLRYFLAHRPDVFVGIDAPEFNLGLESRLHAAGIKTVHYVSPQVWAWRQWRLKDIAKATDLMLTLFPFEAQYYSAHGVPVRCVGHPLANVLTKGGDRSAARRKLGLPIDGPVLAILPGSRANEWHYHVEPFLQAAAWLSERQPGLTCVAAAINEKAADFIQTQRTQLGLTANFSVAVSQIRDVLAAADVVLTVSGTATLETFLSDRPMVIAYRLGKFSYWVARSLVRVPFIGLPNLLAGQRIVPEFIQNEVRPEALGSALLTWLTDPGAVKELQVRREAIRSSLALGGSRLAADAIAELVARR